MPHFMGEIPALDKLVPGEVLLTVPVRDGMVQMHSRPGERTSLAIAINPETVTVAREDGEPLQIQAYFEKWDDGIGDYAITSRILLEEPIERATFIRLPSGWSFEEVVPEEGAPEVKDGNHLISFARLIGMHALAKQQPGVGKR